MQILSIHLKNIKSHRDTELTFAPGINVLSGPNGAGKSTIFEAIGYALFGVDARDFVSNVDRFLSIGAKRGEISVIFRTDSGETWRVGRTVGPAAKWLLARQSDGDFEVEEHAGIEETEQRIAGLLGLAKGRSLAEQFKLVIGPFQNDFLGPFVIRQPTKRQEAFDEILGIDAWRKTYKGTAGMLGAVQEKIKILTAEIDARRDQVAVLPDKQGELAGVKAAEQVKQAELTLRRSAVQAVAEQLAQLDRHKASLDATANELKRIETGIESGKEHIAAQQALVEQSAAAGKIVLLSKAGKERYDAAEARFRELREKDKKRQVLERSVADLDREKSGMDQAVSHETAELTELSAAVAAGAVELADEEQQLQRQLAALREKEQGLKEAAGQVAALQRAFRELPVHRVEGLLPAVKAVLQRLKAIAGEIDRKREMLQGADAVLAKAGQLPALKGELEKLRGERSMLLGRRENLLEGRVKLDEGICPFFQEPCRNISGKLPRDTFTTRVEELDGNILQLDERIAEFSAQLCLLEQADREASTFALIGDEIRRLAQEQEGKNAELRQLLHRIAPAEIRSTLADWLSAAKLPEPAGLAGLVPEINSDGVATVQPESLDKWGGACREIISELEEKLTAAAGAAEGPLQEARLALAGLMGRQEHLQKRHGELAEMRTRIAERQQKIADLNKRLEEAGRELLAGQQKMLEFSGLQEQIARTEEELAACREDRDRYLANIQAAEELEKRSKRLGDYRDRFQALETERAEQLRLLAQLQDGYRSEEHSRVKTELDTLHIAVATVEQQLMESARNRQRLEGEIESFLQVKKEIDGKIEAMKELQRQEVLVKFLRNQVFKNVSSQLSERFREEISVRADSIYRTISESDEELYWGENYRIVLRDMADGAIRERTDDQLSGGQMMSAVVALRLALLQTVGARAAFFDEPTSNLDAGRRENLARAFRAIDVGQEEVTEHWYDQLFLISHDVAFTEITDKIIEL